MSKELLNKNKAFPTFLLHIFFYRKKTDYVVVIGFWPGGNIRTKKTMKVFFLLHNVLKQMQ